MKPLPVLLSLLLIGCAGTTHKINQFQQNPKIKSSQLKGKRVFVAPLLLEATAIGNHSVILGSGKQAMYVIKDSLAKAYGSGLNERFKKRFGTINLVPQPDFARFNSVLSPDKLEETTHFFGKGQVEYYFKHPRKEALDTLGIAADIIIYCTSVGVIIKDVPKKSSGGGGGGWSTTLAPGAGSKPGAVTTFNPNGGGGFGSGEDMTPRMQATVKFIVWDYVADAPVSFGQFQHEDGMDGDEVDRDWRDFANAIADRIAFNTSKLR